MNQHTKHPVWFTPRLPDAAECSLGLTLIERAKNNPDSALMVFENGDFRTCRQVCDAALITAGKIQTLGVQKGDRVLVWLPTGADMVRIIFALSMLGATIVPINTSLRGAMLSRILKNADANILFIHPDLVERLAEAAPEQIETIIVPGENSPCANGLTLISEADVKTSAVTPVLNQPWDIAAIIYSSGTTGLSKGVRVPTAQVWTLSQVFYGYMNADDRMLLMYPLFHIAGFSALYASMSARASIIVTEAFKASEFWDLVRRTNATTTPGLGPTFISILDKADPKPSDTDNPLRFVIVQAITEMAQHFSTRFGISVMGTYSMTETSGIVLSTTDEPPDGRIGRPRDGVEMRIVDGNDVEVECGIAGEVIVRATLPWTLNDGYHNNPEATAAAWRNGWFHTGDFARRDEQGNVFFVDRKKDVIRRRSENISSNEVEAEVRQFPAVQDAAAIAVKHNDDEEVLIVVSPVPGRSINATALIEFLIPRMPHYMVPRFVRIIDELPKTHTNRVQKHELRNVGLTAECWDRESAGIIVRGQRLENN